MVLSRSRVGTKSQLDGHVQSPRDIQAWSYWQPVVLLTAGVFWTAWDAQWTVCLGVALLTAAAYIVGNKLQPWLHRIGGLMLLLQSSAQGPSATCTPLWMILIFLSISSSATFEERLIFSGTITTVVLTSTEPDMGKLCVMLATAWSVMIKRKAWRGANVRMTMLAIQILMFCVIIICPLSEGNEVFVRQLWCQHCRYIWVATAILSLIVCKYSIELDALLTVAGSGRSQIQMVIGQREHSANSFCAFLTISGGTCALLGLLNDSWTASALASLLVVVGGIFRPRVGVLLTLMRISLIAEAMQAARIYFLRANMPDPLDCKADWLEFHEAQYLMIAMVHAVGSVSLNESFSQHLAQSLLSLSLTCLQVDHDTPQLIAIFIFAAAVGTGYLTASRMQSWLDMGPEGSSVANLHQEQSPRSSGESKD